ncbi:uncharacterized protein LOC129753694 [Uranotaenia lowii]|uniref:uncharacterized protein LOC129753694 n=1 Tax=Uranotaenia lowii TaxID=190385 RepID=UPI0024790D58|nr:uncharacterized protein LOC129753694 [Uranotaenia lowii]
MASSCFRFCWRRKVRFIEEGVAPNSNASGQPRKRSVFGQVRNFLSRSNSTERSEAKLLREQKREVEKALKEFGRYDRTTALRHMGGVMQAIDRAIWFEQHEAYIKLERVERPKPTKEKEVLVKNSPKEKHIKKEATEITPTKPSAASTSGPIHPGSGMPISAPIDIPNRVIPLENTGLTPMMVVPKTGSNQSNVIHFNPIIPDSSCQIPDSINPFLDRNVLVVEAEVHEPPPDCVSCTSEEFEDLFQRKHAPYSTRSSMPTPSKAGQEPDMQDLQSPVMPRHRRKQTLPDDLDAIMVDPEQPEDAAAPGPRWPKALLNNDPTLHDDELPECLRGLHNWTQTSYVIFNENSKEQLI